MKLRLWIWIAVFLISCLGAVKSKNCRLFVTKGSIQHSWQSSSLEDKFSTYCLENRSTKYDTPITYQYMHTNEGIQSADAGFHWFVIKLRRPELIGSVNLKARVLKSDEEKSYGDRLNTRAAAIEIWTSKTDLDFGADHCSSKSISSAFSAQTESDTWNWCGKTPTNVSSGDTLTVPCIRNQVRLILLRKNVANETDIVRQCMNFVNMWIDRTRLKTEFRTSTNKSINEAKENTSVTVKCRAECPPDGSLITLTHVDGNRTSTKLNQEIFHVQPSDAGNYTCSAGGFVLSSKHLQVLYPARNLAIYQDNPNCSSTSSAHVTFTFESSASEPAPQHECTAFDSHGNNFTVMNNTFTSSAEDKSLTSTWTCHNCCLTIGPSVLTVSCTAVQAAGPWYSAISEKLYVDSKPEAKHRDSGSSIPFALLTAVAATIGVFLVVFIVFIWVKKKSVRRPAHTAPSLPVASNEVLPEDPLQADVSMAAYVSQLYGVSNDAPECTYASLVPVADARSHAEVLQETGASSRPASDVTEYIEIAADGL